MRDIFWEFGTDMYTLLYLKCITNRDLLYSPGNSPQYSVTTYMGKESEKLNAGEGVEKREPSCTVGGNVS